MFPEAEAPGLCGAKQEREEGCTEDRRSRYLQDAVKDLAAGEPYLLEKEGPRSS